MIWEERVSIFSRGKISGRNSESDYGSTNHRIKVRRWKRRARGQDITRGLEKLQGDFSSKHKNEKWCIDELPPGFDTII